jgi:hypothetical protein
MGVLAASSISGTIPAAKGRSPSGELKRGNWEQYVKTNYPDLGLLDQELIAKYLRAYNKPNKDNDGYKAVKKTVIKRINELYATFVHTPIGSSSRIGLISKLIDFQKIVRGSGLPVNEIKSTYGYQETKPLRKPDPRLLNEIRKGPLEITPEETPIEIKNILSKVEMRKGYSYWQYFKENANCIIFAPKLNEVVKAVDEEYKGTDEELTRTVLIDTFWEKAGMDFEPWMLAATMITEIAHIEWFYKHNGNISLLADAPNQRNAYIAKYQFLSKLSNSPEELVEEKRRPWLRSLMENVAGFIEKFNVELGYPERDFEPHFIK